MAQANGPPLAAVTHTEREQETGGEREGKGGLEETNHNPKGYRVEVEGDKWDRGAYLCPLDWLGLQTGRPSPRVTSRETTSYTTSSTH